MAGPEFVQQFNRVQQLQPQQREATGNPEFARAAETFYNAFFGEALMGHLNTTVGPLDFNNPLVMPEALFTSSQEPFLPGPERVREIYMEKPDINHISVVLARNKETEASALMICLVVEDENVPDGKEDNLEERYFIVEQTSSDHPVRFVDFGIGIVGRDSFEDKFNHDHQGDLTTDITYDIFPSNLRP